LWLAGFENNNNGKGIAINFILSDGTRTVMKCDREMKEYMMPKDLYKQIRKVEVFCDYNSRYLHGFKFFNMDNKLIFELGTTNEYNMMSRVTTIGAD